MNRIDIAERFAKMWRSSRLDAGKSQEYMAKALGVSKKTVQNWESGIGCPNQIKGFEWFAACGLQPMPYYLDLLYPEYEKLSNNSTDAECDAALYQTVKGLTPDQRRKLLFILYGDHGSSPAGIIEMVTAHLHNGLDQRLSVAQQVLTSYEITEALGNARNHIKPNISLLQESITNAKNAIINNQKNYNNTQK